MAFAPPYSHFRLFATAAATVLTFFTFGTHLGVAQSRSCQELVEEDDPLAALDCHLPHGVTPDGECSAAPWSRMACFPAGSGFQTDSGMWTAGYPMDLDLRVGMGPPGLPPRDLNPSMDSQALIAAEAAPSGLLRPYSERATFNNTIDLATGAAMVQAVDFEVPFGGATFRHVRTYMPNVAKHSPWRDTGGNEVANTKFSAVGSRADSQGLFWSMSEKPYLLFDEQYWWNLDRKPRIHLVRDAFTEISFERQQMGPRWVYSSAPWLDAALDHDGELSGDGLTWVRLPTKVYIWLQNRSLKYTFKIHYEFATDEMRLAGDRAGLVQSTGVAQFGSASDVPFTNPNLLKAGLPSLGILESIEDRTGNRVLLHYSQIAQVNCPDDSYNSQWVFPGDRPFIEPYRFGVTPENPGIPGRECCNTCNKVGELKAIELVNSRGEFEWTILYTMREFGISPEATFMMPNGSRFVARNGEADRFQRNLHSIHVYRNEGGRRTLPSEDLTLPWQMFCQNSLSEIAALEHPAIPGDWKLRVNYIYAPAKIPRAYGTSLRGQWVSCDYQNLLNEAPGAIDQGFSDSNDHLPPGARNPSFQGQLLLALVQRRVEDSSRIDTTTTMYRYRRLGFYSSADNHEATLTHIFEDDDIKAFNAKLNDVYDEAGRDFSAHEIMKVSALGSFTLDGASSPPLRLSDYSSWRIDAFQAEERTSHLALSSQGEGTTSHSIGEMLGADLSRTYAVNYNGPRIFSDKRAGAEKRGAFAFYSFRQFPSTYGMSEGRVTMEEVLAPHLLHYPFIFQKRGGTHADLFERLPWHEPLYITVIDEIDEPRSNLYNPVAKTSILSRRVVEINPAGYTLRDRTWRFNAEGGSELVAQIGFGESFKHDCRGRVIEKRSSDWSAIESARRSADCGANPTHPDCSVNPDEMGEITVYRYTGEDACEIDRSDYCECPSGAPRGTSGELFGQGVKLGRNGTPEWKTRIERHSEKPELPLRETRFTVPTADLEGARGETTEYRYEFATGTHAGTYAPPGEDAAELKVVAKTKILPATRLSRDGPPHYSVTKEFFDEDGRLKWSGKGSVIDPDRINSEQDRFTIDYYGYDAEGSIKLEIKDFNPSNVPVSSCGIPIEPPSESPPGAMRPAGPLAALNLITVYRADEFSGDWRAVQSDCSEVHSFTEDTAVQGIRKSWQVTFWREQNSSRGFGTAIISTLQGNRLIERQEAYVEGTGEPSSAWTQNVFTTTRPEYDSVGRIVRTLNLGADGSSSVETPSESTGIEYHASGKISRRLNPTGLVERFTYDERGNLVGTYRGSRDEHEFWGGPPPQDPCSATTGDNLQLVEKRSYHRSAPGVGQMAWLRTYLNRPVNQYSEPPRCGVDPGQNNEDVSGVVHRFHYDWSRNQILKEYFGKRNEILKKELSLFDFQGRPRFFATFGARGPSDSQARSLAISVRRGGNDYDPSNLLSLPGLLSLSETRYNARGAQEEKRVFDILSRDSSRYVSEFSFFDFADRLVEKVEPGTPAERKLFDARGSDAQSALWSKDRELERVQRHYDQYGRKFAEVSWERLPNDETPGELSNASAVRSYSYFWYNARGQEVARAEFGTATSDDTFRDSGTPPLALDGEFVASQSPAIFDGVSNETVSGCRRDRFGMSARVSCISRDSLGRGTATFASDGVTTTSELDSLGRTILETRSTPGRESERVMTAYQFDSRKGTLVKVAAVLPSHNGGSVTKFEDINWKARDGTIQVTEVSLDAQVLNEAGSPISTNPSLISQVRFPDPKTGQPSSRHSTRFAYFPDGMIAQLTTARGVTETRSYDDLRRLTKVLLTEKGEDQTGDSERLFPAHRVHRQEFSYSPDDKLLNARTFNSAKVLTSEVTLGYDGFGNLLRDSQSIGDRYPLDVQYKWESSSGGDGNFLRLKSLEYPMRNGSASTSRILEYGYGRAGLTDGGLKLVQSIESKGSASSNVVEYQYVGAARVARETRGGIITNRPDLTRGVAGWDKFGRVVFTEFAKIGPASGTLERFQYRYDTSGRVSLQTVEQNLAGGIPVPGRSFAYSYDEGGKLNQAIRGTHADDLSGIRLDRPHTITRWNTDVLGNWNGGPGGGVGVLHEAVGGPAYLESQHQEVDARNQVIQLTSGLAGVTETLVSDQFGNLVSDGKLYFQYDGLNRLIRLSENGSLEFNEDGLIKRGTVGRRIVDFHYDGLGRLIRRDKEGASTRFAYDGVRRIAEARLTAPGALQVTREFVYGAQGVDEIVLQAEGPKEEYVLLQNQFGDVVSVRDLSGKAKLQQRFAPYGTLIDQEREPGFTVPILAGHQGLFWESLGDVDGLSKVAPNEGITGLYFARNRWYLPRLGRFLQPDSNSAGLIQVTRAAFMGAQPGSLWMPMDLKGHYLDGLNSYQFQKSAPFSSDPLGHFGFGFAAQMSVMAVDAWTSASGTLDEVLQGVTLFLQTNAMIESYAVTQELDADWATDWSLPDDAYSGAAVMENPMSFGGGEDNGPAMAGSFSATKRIAKMSGKGFKAPSRKMIRDGIQMATQRLGGGSPPRRLVSKSGADAGIHYGTTTKGFRIQPPHVGPNSNHKPGADDTKFVHIDWFDFSEKARSSGGRRGKLIFDTEKNIVRPAKD